MHAALWRRTKLQLLALTRCLLGCAAFRYIDGTQLGVSTGWSNLPCIFEYTGNPSLGEFSRAALNIVL
jgi:hypothetical protein